MNTVYKVLVNNRVKNISSGKRYSFNLARRLNSPNNDVVLRQASLVKGSKVVNGDTLAFSNKGSSKLTLDRSLRDW